MFALIIKHLKRTEGADGYLLPVVIALGAGIGTVSVLALQTVANNSATLNTQQFNVIAREAAQAGIAKTQACIGSLPSSTPLQNGDARCEITSPAAVLNDSANRISSAYTVGRPSAYPATSTTTFLVSATGIVRVSGITAASETVRTLVQTGAAGSAGGTISKQILSISTGVETTCVVAADGLADTSGNAYCWGSNDNGLLGNGWNYQDNQSRFAVKVTQGTQPAQTDSPQHRCSNSWLSLLPDCAPARTSAIGNDKRITKISVGTNHACAIATDRSGDNGRAYCWGNNDNGQLGTRNTSASLVPAAVDLSPYSAAVPGVCNGIRIGDSCIGSWNPAPRSEVVASSLLGAGGAAKTVTDITAGNGFTCALTNDGLVSCWGRNEYGQLGNDDRTDRTYPTSVSYSAATVQDCVRREENWLGQEVCREYRTRLASALRGKQAKALATLKNASTMCVTDTDDAAYCWGQNYAGQMGDGSTVPPSAKGTGSDRHPNANSCNSVKHSAFRSAVRKIPDYDYDVVRPVAVQTDLKFQSLTVTSSTTEPDYLDSASMDGETKIFTYITGTTTDSATNPNRAHYWGGAITFDVRISCKKNGDTYGSDSVTATARVEVTYSGQTTPAGPLYNTSSAIDSGLYGQQLALNAGNAYSGLFCAKLVTNGRIWCDRNEDDSNAGQLGNGYSCTPFLFNQCRHQPDTPQPVSSTSSTPAGQLPLTSTIVAMDVSPTGHTCVIAQSSTRNSAYCWGINSRGQLGNGSGSANTRNQSTPREVDYSSDSALTESIPATAGSPPSIILRGF